MMKESSFFANIGKPVSTARMSLGFDRYASSLSFVLAVPTRSLKGFAYEHISTSGSKVSYNIS